MSYLLRRRVWGTSHTQVQNPRRFTLDRTCLELEYSASCPLWSFKPTARGKQKDTQSKDFTSVRLTLGARTGEVYHTEHTQKKDEGISNPKIMIQYGIYKSPARL